MSGGAGNDLVSGGAGNDRLQGAAGSDRSTGGSGRDVISGASGNDRISARDNVSDTISYGSARDAVTPTAGTRSTATASACAGSASSFICARGRLDDLRGQPLLDVPQARRAARRARVEYEGVEYHATGLDEATIRDLLAKAGVGPRDVLRLREPLVAELSLLDDGVSDDELIAAIAAHPRLLERPIAVRGDRALLARPVERVLELLD
jgi:arsenate reductase